VELHVLGAGPAYTNRPGAIGASYLLVEGDAALVLDLGQGSFAALAAAREPSRVEAVVVSHLHPDHFIDLVALRHYLRYEFDPPRRVAVHGPRELGSRLDALLGEPGFAASVLDLQPLAEGVRRIGPFDVESRLVTHTDESYAFRVSAAGADGPALVYSGDCGRAEDLAPLVRPGDTLLVEVSFGPGPVPPGAFHLDAPAVGLLAASTGAGRVLLTHLQMGFSASETLEIVRRHHAGPTGLVAPGDRHVFDSRSR
jgi:ribonuclease BN (tRNA processing enzyme)